MPWGRCLQSLISHLSSLNQLCADVISALRGVGAPRPVGLPKPLFYTIAGCALLVDDFMAEQELVDIRPLRNSAPPGNAATAAYVAAATCLCANELSFRWRQRFA